MRTLIPGLVIGGVLGAPLGWASRPTSWWGLLLGVALAWVTGILVTELTRSSLAEPAPGPDTLPASLRAAYTEAVQARLGLDVDADPNEALQQARTTLAQAGQSDPVEHLDALRATSRGLYGCLRLAQAWALGLALAPFGGLGLLGLGIGGAWLARRTGIVDHFFDAGPAFANVALHLPAVLAVLALTGFVLSPYAAASVFVMLPAAVGIIGVLEVLAHTMARVHDRFSQAHTHAIVRGFTVLPRA